MAPCDDEAKPRARIDLGESTAFEDGEVGSGPVGGVFAADEIPVLSADHDGSQDALGLVVIDGEVAARGVDDEAFPAVEDVRDGFVHRAGFIIAQQRVGGGAADTIKNWLGVELASSQTLGVVGVFRFTLDSVEFADAVENIYSDEVALFCRDDQATARVNPATESDDAGLIGDRIVRSITVRHPVREYPAERVVWFDFFGRTFSASAGISATRRWQPKHLPQFFRAASADVKEDLIAPDPAPQGTFSV